MNALQRLYSWIFTKLDVDHSYNPDLHFGCAICRGRNAEWWEYFDKYHVPGIADRMRILSQLDAQGDVGRLMTEYARAVAPVLQRELQPVS